jgi:hypothetical protein
MKLGGINYPSVPFNCRETKMQPEQAKSPACSGQYYFRRDFNSKPRLGALARPAGLWELRGIYTPSSVVIKKFKKCYQN